MASYQDLVNDEVPTLVDFTASWCGPCKMQSPELQKLANEYGDRLKIIKIDVDKNPAVADANQVRGVPTLILYKGGKQLWRNSGLHQANQLKGIFSQFGI